MLHTLIQQPWVLGLFAGSTIVFGLPIARLRNISTKTKALFNAISTGILVFLLVEIILTGRLPVISILNTVSLPVS